MRSERFILKDFFPFLAQADSDAVLETFLPYNMTEMNRQNQKRPCVLICPGGGYCFCSQREAEPIALRFTALGYNAFILWYSNAPKTFPLQIREAAAAMEMIYKNCDEWNCDTGKIAIGGFSAGGHLAAHYSTCFDCDEVREVLPESKAPNASILCYPVITANPEFAHLGSFQNLLGKEVLTDEEIEKFSCDCRVTDHTPPAFIWHTAEDTCVPVMNSLCYATAMSNHKIPFELHIYPFGAHGLATADGETCDALPPQVNLAADWISSCAKWLQVIFN